MLISLIVAMAANRVIGDRGQMPWYLPSDLQRFRRLTMGHSVVLGRRTYEAIGRPLPGRRNIVVSREAGYRAPGCEVVLSLEAALQSAATENELFICGGEQIYRQALPLAGRIYLTELEQAFPGTAHFPDLPPGQFRVVASERVDDCYNYCFMILERLLDR